MPASPDQNRHLGKFGRIVKPISFDPIQFMWWERDGIYTLELETYVGGVISAHVELTPEISAVMAQDLRAIRDAGMKGDWNLGTWARGARLRFKGPTESGDARGDFSTGYSAGSFRVRQASFDSLLQELEVLSSNKAMERTVNDKVPGFARAFGALNRIWRRWAAAHRPR